MAAFLASKTVSEAVARRWLCPVDDDDGAANVATSASGITVSSATLEGNEVVLALTGGTAAETGSIVVTVTTSRGRTAIETIYVPIVQSAAQIADTAESYINFALRPVIGNGETASADEASDALERLNALVAEWRAGGADIGAPFPITTPSVIYCPDWAVNALRYNLLIECAPLYGFEPKLVDYEKARRGKQLIKHMGLPDDRESAFA